MQDLKKRNRKKAFSDLSNRGYQELKKTLITETSSAEM